MNITETTDGAACPTCGMDLKFHGASCVIGGRTRTCRQTASLLEPTRFRRKPTEIDAHQFFMWHPIKPVGVKEEHVSGDPDAMEGKVIQFYVTTAHGQKVYLQDGDWIIAEPDGRGHYPVKPDIFAATYDAVTTAPTITP